MRANDLSILADASTLEEVKNAFNNGAEGIGLLRTEKLFDNSANSCPEEEQVSFYREVINLAGSRPVTIRTYFGNPQEEMKGDWGVRFYINHPGEFQIQLRAILKAGVQGNINIVIPGTADAEQFKWVKQQLQQVKQQLQEQNVDYNNYFKLGIMVEIPAVVILLEMLIHEVNFFVIDTDKLLWNLMVMDKINNNIVKNPLQPALLRAIKQMMTVRPGINVSVCGSMALLELSVPILKGIDINSAIVKESDIPKIKRLAESLNVEDCRRIASKAFALSNSMRVSDYIEGAIKKLI
ncbi:MAG: hypothetical protein H0Z40_10220 [Desulfotomaculum sp.]|nr:hypothetical protein [Desulfotomaculum sp.]